MSHVTTSNASSWQAPSISPASRISPIAEERLPRTVQERNGPSNATAPVKREQKTIHSQDDFERIFDLAVGSHQSSDTAQERDYSLATDATIATTSGVVSNMLASWRESSKTIEALDLALDLDNSARLHLAALKGDQEAAKRLIQTGVDLNVQNKDGNTALHLAIRTGNRAIAAALMNNGAGLSVQNRFGDTPLHLAIKAIKKNPSLKGQFLMLIKALINGSSNPNIQNQLGQTPLTLAKQMDLTECVCLLNPMALFEAILKKDYREAITLIEQGADLSAQDVSGDTALHLAIRTGNDGIAEALINNGAGLSIQNHFGDTPLHLALRNRAHYIVLYLLEESPDLTIKNDFGSTLLHEAIQNGDVKTARRLIRANAEVNAQDNDGDTPLHLAIRVIEATRENVRATNAWVAVVNDLIQNGADSAIQNNSGQTPLSLAQEMDLKELSESLT